MAQPFSEPISLPCCLESLPRSYGAPHRHNFKSWARNQPGSTSFKSDVSKAKISLELTGCRKLVTTTNKTIPDKSRNLSKAAGLLHLTQIKTKVQKGMWWQPPRKCSSTNRKRSPVLTWSIRTFLSLVKLMLAPEETVQTHCLDRTPGTSIENISTEVF